MNKRNYIYDQLKVIALICIMLAHVNPNSLIFQIRNFDVPLMVLISVWLSLKTINDERFSYRKYIIKRIERLVKPTWIFLTIYFIINLFFGQLFTLREIIGSYLLVDGIGYVWIIRIYIFIAIITPLINYFFKKSKILLFIVITTQILIYYFMINYSLYLSDKIQLILNVTVLDFIGYSFIVYIAIFINKVTDLKKGLVAIIFGLIYITLAFHNNFLSTQLFKYPLRLYYLAYAIFVGILLYLLFKHLNTVKNEKKYIIFTSKNSMWIYLWHIMYINVVNNLFNEVKYGFLMRLLILLVLSIITVYFQNFILNNIQRISSTSEDPTNKN
jgi:fucose 4-O-acetylase-like acetyltransferase